MLLQNYYTNLCQTRLCGEKKKSTASLCYLMHHSSNVFFCPILDGMDVSHTDVIDLQQHFVVKIPTEIVPSVKRLLNSKYALFLPPQSQCRNSNFMLSSIYKKTTPKKQNKIKQHTTNRIKPLQAISTGQGLPRHLLV